jgi:hypothetical protein
MVDRNRPPLLTRHSSNSWRAARLVDILDALNAHPELERWKPHAGDVRAKNEAERYYHRPPGERWVTPAAIVCSFDGWIRTTGADAQRAAAILDAFTEQPAPAADLPQVEQLGLFAEAAR